MITGRRPLVLLADGNRDARQMYAEFFGYHGFHVVTVVTGRDALTLATGVDVLITESRLAGDVDGLEVVSRLKSDEATTGIPVIVVSAHAWDADRLRAEHAGCDLFLTKPCLPVELLAAVRRLLVGQDVAAPRPGTLALEAVGKPDEHADDLESEVRDGAEEEVDDYPDTAEDFEEVDDDDVDFDDDEAELRPDG